MATTTSDGGDVVLPVQKPKKWEDVVKYFEFQWQRDSPGEAREALLVVAALIATVTFQAGITPPSRLSELNTSHKKLLFLIPNSIALSTAITMIDYLTGGFPFQRELLVSMWAMMFTYGCSLGFAIAPCGAIIYALLGLSLFTPQFVRFLPGVLKKLGE